MRPSYKMVDTCAGEFPSATPYLYGSYDEESEAPRTGRRSVVILGSGPNRIGQGVEFDYCCVRAVIALRERGFETIMINSNPETVSTDFDTSDKLYFEPLTLEDVLEIVRARAAGRRDRAARRTDAAQAHARARGGGREDPRNVADSIDIAEDRRRFDKIARELGHRRSRRTARRRAWTKRSTSPSESDIRCSCDRRTCSAGARCRSSTTRHRSSTTSRRAVRVSEERPVLIDRFLEDAFEGDVDAISDGTRVVIGGIMQHIEDAGIHSGDSACVLPPYLIGETRHARRCASKPWRSRWRSASSA